MSESYEALRDGATGEGGEAWRAADREESNLRALYRELKEDPRYTEEHKADKAWGAYEDARDKIAAGKAKARELLEKQARTVERFSVPVPGGEGLVTTDAQKLLASQNEATRIVRKLDRMAASAKGPVGPDRVEVLREEYRRGLDIGGMQGGVICRGVLEAADELGVDKHAVVDSFRKERHHESLERAQLAARLTDLIGGKVPEPPFTKPGEGFPRGGGSEPRRGSGALLIPRGPKTGSGRRPPWR